MYPPLETLFPAATIRVLEYFSETQAGAGGGAEFRTAGRRHGVKVVVVAVNGAAGGVDSAALKREDAHLLCSASPLLLERDARGNTAPGALVIAACCRHPCSTAPGHSLCIMAMP